MNSCIIIWLNIFPSNSNDNDDDDDDDEGIDMEI